MKYLIIIFKTIINIKNNRKNLKDVKKNIITYIIACILLYGFSAFIGIICRFAKPIIYLYPTKKEKVKVKVKYPEKLICTYPKYEDNWEVVANPNGELEDCKTGRKLYALYWEGKRDDKPRIDKGFCIRGEDSIKFLEEKLAQLGLNERESEEFIVYWLPKLEKNKYNLIKFELTEDINKHMSLDITPIPDTLIRINMVFKKSSKSIEIEPQEIITPERNGFTVVEWGGTEI